jgi:hypothetical protein
MAYQNKKCSHCKQEKSQSDFYKNKTFKNGLDCYCKDCRKEKNLTSFNKEARAKYLKKYSAEHADYLKEYYKKWAEENKQHLSTYRKNKREELAEYQRQWRLKNGRLKELEKRKNSVSDRIQNSFRSIINHSLRDGKGHKKTFDILGYSIEKLKRHIEKQFLPGMGWHNYGQWHIDHKIPLSAFNYQSVDDFDFKRAWALKNLQPLWKIDNLSKNNRLERPFQPALIF